MTRCVIFDIDGTLADHRHRLHHITSWPKNHEAFFAAMHLDGVHPAVVELARILDQTGNLVFVSGRPDRYRQVTVTWLLRIGISLSTLYMRADGDCRPDHIVKRELLAEILADGWKPWLVIDDRPQVVAMWRAEGLTCLQAAYQE